MAQLTKTPSRQSSLEYWLSYISRHNPQTIDMGLGRMYTLLERLGLDRPRSKILTVAGTNGKGSTAIACESLLVDAGLLVGTTLSPHIHRYNERFRIGAEELDDARIVAALAAVDEARDDIPLTYFEFSALAALWLFDTAAVDVAVLEIGLGGRLDAFNAVSADVAVVTSIGIDHTEYLGATRELIGAEKAGIFRPGQNIVLGAHMPDSVLQAAQTGRCARFAVDFTVDYDEHGWRLRVGSETSPLQPFSSTAAHNQALAMMACRALLGHEQLSWAPLQSLLMPGRLERHHKKARQWWLDVAHNAEGVAFLIQELSRRGVVPDLLVCGMLREKPHAQVLAAMRDWAAVPWILLDTDGERGLQALTLASHLEPGVVKHCLSVCDTDLLGEVLSRSDDGDTIVAFGSFDCVARCQHMLS